MVTSYDKFIARAFMPFLVIFLVLLPARQVYASNLLFPPSVTTLAMGGATSGYVTLGILGNVSAGALVVPYGAIGFGLITVGMQVGSVLICTGLTIASGFNNPCVAVPTGTGTNAQPNFNPTNLPSVTTVGQTCVAFNAPIGNRCVSGGSSSLTSAQMCSAVGGIGGSGGAPYYGVCYLSPSSATSASSSGTTGCGDGYTYYSGPNNCQLTNINATHDPSNKQTTVSRSGTALTVTVSPYSLQQITAGTANSQSIAPNAALTSSNIVQIGGLNGNSLASTDTIIALTGGGSSITMGTDNGNGTTTLNNFITDSNGNVTSVSAPVTVSNGSNGSGSSGTVYSSASGVVPNSTVTTDISNIASSVVGQSGVIGIGTSGTFGGSAAVGGGGTGVGNAGNTSSSGSSSGTGGCVGTLSTPCVSTDVSSLDGSTYASAPSDSTGSASAVSSGSSAASAAFNSGGSMSILNSSAVAATSATTGQINSYASAYTIALPFSSYVNAGDTDLNNCNAMWGASGVPSIKFNGSDSTQLYNVCSSSTFLLIPTLFDWFAGISTIAIIWLGTMNIFSRGDENV